MIRLIAEVEVDARCHTGWLKEFAHLASLMVKLIEAGLFAVCLKALLHCLSVFVDKIKATGYKYERYDQG
jgi:hypothetical protein